MPRYLCKVQDGDKAYYMEWSTITDSPVTTGMPLEELKEQYCDDDFEDRMKRVEAKGTSSRLDDSFDKLISGNRAGKNESCLSKEQIIEWYCRRAEECGRGVECPIMGKVFNFDTEKYEDAKEP